MSDKPIGQRNTVPSDGFDQGEHGAGVGLAGGVGNDHHSSHPIADKFMSQSTTDYSALGTGRVPLSQGITGAIDSDRQGFESSQTGQQSHEHHHHGHHHHGAAAGHSEHRITADHNDLNLGQPVGISSGHTGGHSGAYASDQYGAGQLGSGQVGSAQYGQGGVSSGGHHSVGTAVSGAYEGGGTRDALTGQSRAETTGAGVGPLGENVPHTSGVGASALAGTAAGAAAGSGLAGGTHSNLSTAKEPVQTGVGAAGGAGGHYSSESASGAQQTSNSSAASKSSGGGAAGSGGAGHYGNAEHDPTSGEPVSDPKALDTGGPHSLVYQESTGQYVHRRDLEK